MIISIKTTYHIAKESHHIVASSSSRADEEEVERRVGALDNGGPRRRLDGDGIASDVLHHSYEPIRETPTGTSFRGLAAMMRPRRR